MTLHKSNSMHIYIIYIQYKVVYMELNRIYEDVLPISLATSMSFDFVLEMSTILMPRLANCLAYSRPMPSVEPVITV